MKSIPALIVLLLVVHCTPSSTDQINTNFAGKPEVPSVIKEQHAGFLKEVEQWALLNDSTGNCAKNLLTLLQHHFQEEEDYALPLLGLLPSLANDSIPDSTSNMIALSDKLKEQLTHLNAEHQMIMYEVKRMADFAVAENHPEVAAFETVLAKHAKEEEEVLFPAAIVVGDYLGMKSSSGREQ